MKSAGLIAVLLIIAMVLTPIAAVTNTQLGASGDNRDIIESSENQPFHQEKVLMITTR